MRTGREGVEMESGLIGTNDPCSVPQFFQIGEQDEPRSLRSGLLTLEDWVQAPMRLEDVPRDVLSDRPFGVPGVYGPAQGIGQEMVARQIMGEGSGHMPAVGAHDPVRGFDVTLHSAQAGARPEVPRFVQSAQAGARPEVSGFVQSAQAGARPEVSGFVQSAQAGARPEVSGFVQSAQAGARPDILGFVQSAQAGARPDVSGPGIK